MLISFVNIFKPTSPNILSASLRISTSPAAFLFLISLIAFCTSLCKIYGPFSSVCTSSSDSPSRASGSFQLVPQSPLVPPAFFSVDILPFLSLIHFTNHFLCNPWFSCLFSTLPTKSLIVSNTHALYFSTALPHSQFHIQLHRVSLLEYSAHFVFEYIASPNPI